MVLSMSANNAPLKFKSAKELDLMITDYFLWCDIQKEPYTITGLALHLDTYKGTLFEYIKGVGRRVLFQDQIKKAVLRCENYAERMTYLKSNPGGPIFILKNYGWSDIPAEEPDEYEDDGFEDAMIDATLKAFEE